MQRHEAASCDERTEMRGDGVQLFPGPACASDPLVEGDGAVDVVLDGLDEGLDVGGGRLWVYLL